MADPAPCADVINALVFYGEQRVSPEDLQDVDTQIYGLRISGFVRYFIKEKTWRKTKYRDMVRRVAFGMNFVIIGIENQENLVYSLPLRNMVYDVGEDVYDVLAGYINMERMDIIKGEYM